jgi:hypothetical protein
VFGTRMQHKAQSELVHYERSRPDNETLFAAAATTLEPIDRPIGYILIGRGINYTFAIVSSLIDALMKRAAARTGF